jgi:hypothetical protein
LFNVAAIGAKLRRLASSTDEQQSVGLLRTIIQQETRRPKAKAGLSKSSALAGICNAPRQAENQIGANFNIRFGRTAIKHYSYAP